MQEFMEKIEQVKKTLGKLIEEGNDMIPNEEYLCDQERIDACRNIFQNIDLFISIFKIHYYKNKRVRNERIRTSN